MKIFARIYQFLFSSERGSFSFKSYRLASLQKEVDRLTKMVEKRNRERAELQEEKKLQEQLVELRKELGIEV